MKHQNAFWEDIILFFCRVPLVCLFYFLFFCHHHPKAFIQYLLTPFPWCTRWVCRKSCAMWTLQRIPMQKAEWECTWTFQRPVCLPETIWCPVTWPAETKSSLVIFWTAETSSFPWWKQRLRSLISIVQCIILLLRCRKERPGHIRCYFLWLCSSFTFRGSVEVSLYAAVVLLHWRNAPHNTLKRRGVNSL